MRKITLRTGRSLLKNEQIGTISPMSQRIKSFMRWLISPLSCAHEQYSIQRKMKEVDLPLESLVKAIMRKATEATNSIKHKTMRYFFQFSPSLKMGFPCVVYSQFLLVFGASLPCYWRGVLPFAAPCVRRGVTIMIQNHFVHFYITIRRWWVFGVAIVITGHFSFPTPLYIYISTPQISV